MRPGVWTLTHPNFGAGSTAIEYDTLEVKIDGTTTAMTGTLDDTVVNDDFADSVLSLTQDETLDTRRRQGQAGNLTSDGLYDYEFDAWNRLVEVQYADGTDIAFATYMPPCSGTVNAWL